MQLKCNLKRFSNDNLHVSYMQYPHHFSYWNLFKFECRMYLIQQIYILVNLCLNYVLMFFISHFQEFVAQFLIIWRIVIFSCASLYTVAL